MALHRRIEKSPPSSDGIARRRLWITWIGGIIESTENGTLYLPIGGVVRGFPMRAIRKARLDHTMEAKEKGHAI